MSENQQIQEEVPNVPRKRGIIGYTDVGNGGKDNYQGIYQQIMQGNLNLGGLIGVANQIIRLVPELDPSGGNGINNFSQKQLEDIVIKFIKKCQLLQESNVKRTNNYNPKNDNKNFNIKKKWEGVVQQYYLERRNHIKDIADILGGDPKQNYNKIYNAFNKLCILQDVIYDKKRHEFQFIHIPASDGLRAIKLNINLFKILINYKSNLYDGNSNAVGNSDNFKNKVKPLLEQFAQAGISRNLHPNVKDTTEYKYIIQLMNKVNLDKRYTRVNKRMQRINQRKDDNDINVDTAVNKMVNKLKQFKNTDGYKDRINFSLLDNNRGATNKPLAKLQYELDNNMKVLTSGDELKNKLQEKKRESFNDRLVKELKYVPNGDTQEQDVKLNTSKQKSESKFSQKIFDMLKKEFKD